MARYTQIPMEDLDDHRSQPLLGSEQFDSASLLQGEGREHWEAISNLDLFFERLYNYYLEKGFICIVIKRILNLMTLAFTILFSAFLLLFVDWKELLHRCRIENECDNITAVDWHALDELTNYEALVLVYLILFSLYWIWNVYRLLMDIRDNYEVKQWYDVKLGISERDLQTIEWSEVVDRLIHLQATLRLCIVKEDVTAHDIALRIMRKENYLIAFINRGLLPLHLPLPFLDAPVLTKTLEWNIYFCILNYMFDDKFRVRRDFVENEQALRRRFIVLGFVNLFLSPFLIIFMVVYFIMRNAEQFYSKPTTIGARQWTPYSRWLFREFNELPHIFHRRIAESYIPADEYLQQFPQYLISMLARFVTLVVGSFAAVLAFIGLVNSQALNNEWMGQKLWWYIAVFGGILAVSRALVEPRDYVFKPVEALETVAKNTHYMPKRWRGNEHTLTVRNEFAELYEFKVVIFFMELFGIIFTPLILWFALPDAVPQLIEFVDQFTRNVDGVGDVCGFAVFDFDAYGNSRYGANSRQPRDRRTRQGKMEKSYLNFKAHHPTWSHSHGEQFEHHLAESSEYLASSKADMAMSASVVPGLAPRSPGSSGQGIGASTQLLTSNPEASVANQFFLLDRFYQRRQSEKHGHEDSAV
eukprot:TRINITY_DN2204_c0_g1::TRINITY_DN2204_c0_g1_i1::g.6795::m.6795 TRINITY_DN2204_c0_g1::TRINITY_DN2204_c0_g1_i1::g.6795  ORF type:complete len:643 (-),score=90.70,sp/Q8RUS5/ATG9_ARATH/39.49/7e-154,APG9/PF04109.11/8.2e-128,DUF4231/PF14015.1/1.3e+04,DUF4231/PF14015.1/0.033 TRINITY_DN2204_c0_g1_i1:613-2541(-)